MPDSILQNLVVCERGEQKYLIFYDDASTRAALMQAGYWASDEDLAFSWYDAEEVSAKIKSMAEKAGVDWKSQKGVEHVGTRKSSE